MAPSRARILFREILRYVPKLEDCYEAMFRIPYSNAPAKDTPDAKALRVFAKPQYLSPPFKAVKNPYALKAIVQLPKCWKHGMWIFIRTLLRLVSFFPLRYSIKASAA